MKTRDRHACLNALGLVDWRTRVDGPLGTPRASDEAGDVMCVGPAHTESSGVPARRAAQFMGQARAAPPSAPDDSVVAQSSVPGPSTRSPGAVSGMDWDALEAYLASCDHRGAQRPVFGIGARAADLLIVGEAPGAQEDKYGVPFVGRAGKLLDRMLFAIGCSRETNVYITNICKFRPPNNRDPRPEEVAADWPVLERQIELMNPSLVVAVGRVAAQTLLDSKESLGGMRGRLHKYPRRDLDVLVTYHPAFLLRSPGQKARAWVDLKTIAAHIGRTGRAA